MALKILTLIIGIALLIGFIFFERRMNAIFKGRSKYFYWGVGIACVLAFIALHTLDFIYILLALAVIISGLTLAPIVAPWIIMKWRKIKG